MAAAQAIVVQPSYRLGPDDKRFPAPAVQRMIEQEVESALEGKAWSPEAAALAVTLAERVKALAKDLLMPRYKLLAFVVLGENRLQGVRVTSRCLWDTATDNYASVSYKNDTIFCTVMVFGVYVN